MLKRYVVELGTGVDLHGMDVTKAACRAVKNAISQSCLCGLAETLEMDDPARTLHIDVTVAAPFPEQVDQEKVAAVLPFGSVSVHVEEGGLKTPGLAVPSLGEGSTIVVANAALSVQVDLP
jgi:uncharacterized protein (TIGR02058 family)